MYFEIDSQLGRDIRAGTSSSSFKLRSSGKYGALSFVLSCVEDGQDGDFQIENEAVALCGEDIRQTIFDAVVEGMDRYWRREGGNLKLLHSGALSPAPDRSTSNGLKHGFDMLEGSENLKFAFDRAGVEGRISFAKACIWSGLVRSDEISEKACAISGSHAQEAINVLLMEGENIHWRKDVDDNLELIGECDA